MDGRFIGTGILLEMSNDETRFSGTELECMCPTLQQEPAGGDSLSQKGVAETQLNGSLVDSSRRSTPHSRIASERRGNTFKEFQGLNLKATARIGS